MSDAFSLQVVLLALVVLLICCAIFWLAYRIFRQWNRPSDKYRAQMEDIQRRKRELGIVDDETNS